ncbi:MAG: hypothetical protein COB73_05010 [Flavobacteriaceae bacterium]|nr:MAG: hypothetical protein COB73_05010 [Flavobacteriaceae bacterium]
MKAHTTYKIFPKAIEVFINEHYELGTINFGNVENNVKAILQKLKIDDILECQWDVTHLFFFDKIDISKKNNKPSDFDEYANFKFSFTSKIDKNTTKEYEQAIEKLEAEFINKYQNKLEVEFQKFKTQEAKKKKRKEMLTYIFTGLVFVALAAVLVIYKLSQE